MRILTQFIWIFCVNYTQSIDKISVRETYRLKFEIITQSEP